MRKQTLLITGRMLLPQGEIFLQNMQILNMKDGT